MVFVQFLFDAAIAHVHLRMLAQLEGHVHDHKPVASFAFEEAFTITKTAICGSEADHFAVADAQGL